jgi:predicted nucleic acid-binding protein
VKRVFVDTGGFFALLAANDHNHERARDLFERASRERWRLVTTNAVVTETYTLLLVRTREARTKAVAFLDGLGASGVRVERVRASDEQRAADLVRHHRDKAYSLCDAFSFVVMQRLGIVEVIAFDRHFREYGKFTVL